MSSPVAFLDLAALHAPLRDDLDKIWHQSLRDSSFIGGEAVTKFEGDWAAYCGTDHAVGVANGTDAIELALVALEIGPGHEVIVPTNTFVATAEAVVNVGATPVFVDVDEATLLITAEHIESAITERTQAVIVVHLYGAIPSMEPIQALCQTHGLKLIEDSAQAHGATHNGVRAGAFGDAATFSFYPGKNLGALGDGGALVTNDDEVAKRVRILANHGRGDHLLHVVCGRNSRLDGLQAAALACKLTKLDAWNERRRQVHLRYREAFAGSAVRTLETPPGTEGVHHLEVVRVANRDEVLAALADAEIGAGIHYAMPCHLQPAFEIYAGSAPMAIAERAAKQQLSIPLHPTLPDAEIDRVVDVVGSTAHQVPSS